MHAVVVWVEIGDAESAEKVLREDVVPRVSQAPGFVAGYWTSSEQRDNGLSMIVFDSEEEARSAAERVREVAPPGVTVEDVQVREVVANA